VIRVGAPALDPGEALARVARGTRPFLLDGGLDADGLGGVSWAGCDPDDGLTWGLGDAGDPFALLAAAQKRWQGAPLAVGYLSYDIIQKFARRRLHAVDELGMPALDFARYPAAWRLEEGRAEVWAVDAAAAEKLLGRLRRDPPPLSAPRLGPPRWAVSDEEYRRRVGRVLDYLAAGDCYQVNLSHRVRAVCADEDALAFYLRLRRDAPAPLGAYLSTGAGTLVSNSPELFLRQRGRHLETRPIKGTRPRGGNADEDARLAAELESSPKDAAEHLMIVDLERNDLGRVAEVGSVRVEGFRRRVELPTVHHLVSTVAANLRPDVDLEAILRATFPGGSITGAPKLRAVEIIDELEGVMRGPYCGALGLLGAPGRVDLSLAIRTAVVRAGELVLSVGGGIVADSRPDDELAETRVKAAAFLKVLGSA
jgi:para-aminobenzoate synthetase component 1